MAYTSVGRQDAARALLRRESRALRGHVMLPVALGVAGILATLGATWLMARLLAALLGFRRWPGAGWPELAAAAALALLGAGLGLAQERAQLAAGEAARTRLRDLTFARLLAAGPADPRGVGERAALVVDRVEALDGYFAPLAADRDRSPCSARCWSSPPPPGPIRRAACCWPSPGCSIPSPWRGTGIGAAQASRRQFEALERLSGRFLDRMRGLPTLVLFNRQEAEADGARRGGG